MSLVLDEHRQYLADENRIQAFRSAIQELVRPGDVVVDLGAGTGILGLLACQAGAGRVFSIEAGSIIGVARDFGRANGYADRITFVRELSTRAVLSEQADVVVTDQVGHFGFDAGIVGYVADARKRFLKPGARLIPSCVDLLVAPIEDRDLWKEVQFWDAPVADLDVRAALPMARATGYPRRLTAGQLLGGEALLCAIDLGVANLGPIVGEVTVQITRPGLFTGVGGWFSAVLSPSIVMTNSPLAARPINRRNVFFPIDEAVEVERGDQVRIGMHILPAESLVIWSVTLSDASGRRKTACRRSTFEGMLLSSEELKRTRPDFVPRLSPAGQARRTTLELCDGTRRLSAIEEEVFNRHRDVFGRSEDAAAFVAEVVSIYAR